MPRYQNRDRAQSEVALRKESVDRNTAFLAARVSSLASLSARRAWIEILSRRCFTMAVYKSLSARRAWIEMGYG